MKKIALIPIDNRPICYSLIEQISAINKDIKLYLPEKNLLGGLIKSADTKSITEWVLGLEDLDYIIVSLDTAAYGGLVSSRRSNDTFETVKTRISKFTDALKRTGAKVYAFSSIMRISDNNINEEEKEYWDRFGKRIFSYSYHQHKSRVLKEMNCVINTVPKEILEDYLNTRKRNFEINRLYLDFLDKGIFDTLVYSKDDTGQYGLNVEEAQKLEYEAKERNLNAIIRTGADEIPLTLLARAIADNRDVKCALSFAFEDSKGKISKYEDVSVENCVKSQLSLAGVDIETYENADILMYVNNFDFEQGDLVLGDTVNTFKGKFIMPEKPFFIADINNANGSDNGFIRLLGDKIFKSPDFIGYAAYNTSANTIGCSLCIALNAFLSKENDSYDDNAFKRLAAIRLLDDWAYQSNIRKQIRQADPDFINALNNACEEFSRYGEKIKNLTGYDIKNVKYSLPWNRSFEIEVDLQ